MPRFFCENFSENAAIITGDDARHISRSLRMKIGEELTVCNTKGTDYFCKITGIRENEVMLDVMESAKTVSEPSVEVTLFQCMPKSDKLETVVQKAVELGVNQIVPVISERCISRPDAKSVAKKRERLQKIANEAAKQSGRGVLPTVENALTFKECCSRLSDFDISILFYELGGEPLTELGIKDCGRIAILIGPEGGFSKEEADTALKNGAKAATLGKRILRTETAPLAALTGIMLLSGNLQ